MNTTTKRRYCFTLRLITFKIWVGLAYLNKCRVNGSDMDSGMAGLAQCFGQ